MGYKALSAHWRLTIRNIEQLIPFNPEFERLVQSEINAKNLVRKDPNTAFISSVSGSLITDANACGPEYWSSNFTLPVKFHSAVRNLLQQMGEHTFLEIGPHSTLKRPLRDICTKVGAPCAYIPMMLRSALCYETFLSGIGQLHQQGASVNLEHLVPNGTVLTDIPSYS